MNYIKKIIYSLIATPFSLMASAVTPFAVKDENTGMGLVAIIYGLIFYVGVILAIIFILQGLLKLLNNAKNPNDPRNSIKGAMLAILAGAILTNIHQSTSLVINTVTGGTTCFIGADQSLSDSIKRGLTSDSCFNPENSEITKSFRERLTSNNTDGWEEFKKRIAIFFAVIQTIGLFYFLKSVALLKSAGDGNNNASYGKILIMMAFSAIAMDMLGFLNLFINTYRAFVG